MTKVLTATQMHWYFAVDMTRSVLSFMLSLSNPSWWDMVLFLKCNLVFFRVIAPQHGSTDEVVVKPETVSPSMVLQIYRVKDEKMLYYLYQQTSSTELKVSKKKTQVNL